MLCLGGGAVLFLLKDRDYHDPLRIVLAISLILTFLGILFWGWINEDLPETRLPPRTDPDRLFT